MSAKLLRLVYVCEFLLALVAIFTSWSEVGGQAALDAMFWPWKLGLGIALAAAIVALTAAFMADDAILTLRTARWLAVIIVLLAAIGTITYYYSLQEDNGDSDDSGTISQLQDSPIRLETAKVPPIREL